MTNTQEKASKVFAYCWRGGVVEFGPDVPRNAVRIAHGNETRLREVVSRVARWSHVTDTFILDSVQKAWSDDAATAAAYEAAFWIEEELSGREAA